MFHVYMYYLYASFNTMKITELLKQCMNDTFIYVIEVSIYIEYLDN